MDVFTQFNITPSAWIIVVVCGMLTGMSKTGVTGAGLMVVPLMASVFGGKPSTGLLLPMLVFADIFAVLYYRRHADWTHILRLLPWALAGIVIALFVGKNIHPTDFRILMGVVVMVGVIIMIYRDLKKNIEIPTKPWFSAVLGLAGGFSTMIGNAAGPVMALYLLSMKFHKNKFIGTGAWFFFIINLTKVPLHLIFWKTITWSTLTFDIILLPAVALGAVMGYFLIKVLPEKFFRILVISTTLVAASLLFVTGK